MEDIPHQKNVQIIAMDEDAARLAFNMMTGDEKRSLVIFKLQNDLSNKPFTVIQKELIEKTILIIKNGSYEDDEKELL